MDKQEDLQTRHDKQSHSNKSKMVLIIIGIAIAILLFFISTLFLRETKNNPGALPVNPSPFPSQNAVNPSQAVNRNFNPLINNAEVERVENSLRKKMEEAGITISPKPVYKFHYKLDPALKNKSSFRIVKPALAANTCNITSAPAVLPIYSLKDHLTVIDAREVAALYDIKDDPKGSLPSLDGASFDYFFSDAVVSQFLQVTEPSGVSYWHRVVDATGANSGQVPATTAQTELEKHKLSDKAVLKTTKTDPASGFTIFHYEKNYDNLSMTDKASIMSLGPSSSVCSVTPTTLMNYIDIYVTPNGYFQKLVNKTKHTLQSYPVKRATLEESLSEYQTYPPIDPIVIGGGDTTGDVTIDEAVLVWYDYGDSMPQTAYIPMYLTSGKTPSGTRVLTLFPALTKQTMNDTKIPQLSSESRDTLQMYTFNPPFAAPPAPANPGEGTPYPTIPGLGSPICSGTGSGIGSAAVVAGSAAVGLATSIGGTCPSGDTPGTGLTLGAPGTALGGCFGGRIDGGVQCTDSSGMVVCNIYGSTATDRNGYNDPFGVCENGPQTRSETLALPAGSNPCDEYMKKYNISGFNINPYKYNTFTGGAVQCRYTGGPC